MAKLINSVCCCVFVLFLALGPNSARAALSVSPLNDAVLVGETVVLVCEAGEAPPATRIMWGEFITNSGGTVISDNEDILDHPNSDRYRIVHNTPTEFGLEISNVQLTDGGKYVCQDSLSGPPDVFRGEAELIVIGSNPNCTTTAPDDGNVLEGQNFTIECIINFQGYYPPTMTWSGPPPFTVGGATNPTDVWSGIRYTVDRSMDTRAFECLTNFTDMGDLPADVADNVPTWEHLHRAPQIFVFWGPKNIFAEPIKPEYIVNDTLTCHADAMPPASYQWQNMRTLEVFQSQTFTVTEDLVGTNQTMRCQAQNLIAGLVYSANLFEVVYVPTPTTPTTPPTTTPTTTQPLESPCLDLTGHWRSDDPYSEMILEVVDGSEIGEVTGIMKNLTDTVWVEVIGTVRKSDFAFLGLTAIWPFDDGITGMAAECHRCSGVEVLISDGLWRSIADSANCGEGSIPEPYTPYRFNRIDTVAAAVQAGATKSVKNPSKITKRLEEHLKK